MTNSIKELSEPYKRSVEWRLMRVKAADDERKQAAQNFRRGHQAIGESMRDLRRTGAIPLVEIARAMEISEGALMQLENGNADWSAGLIESFVEALRSSFK